MCPDEESEYHDFAVFGPYLEREHWREVPEVQDVCCPLCGKPLAKDPDDIWLKRGNTGYYTLQQCSTCGPWFVRYKLARRDGLHWRCARICQKPLPLDLDKWKKQRAKTIARMRHAAEKAARERVENAGK